MVFTVIAQSAPMYATGERLGEDWYEIMPGVRMYFYDRGSIEREFESCGLTEISEIDEPSPHGGSLPFINVICAKGPTPATRL